MPVPLYYPVGDLVEKRFWSKVDKNHPDAPVWNGTKCWLWTAGKSEGYGQFNINDHDWGAHVVSWTLAKKKPPTKHVLHHCDIRPCVNDAHLFEGTHQDNMRDREIKGRANHPRGDRHGLRLHPESVLRGEKSTSVKLTEMQVRCIRSLYRRKQISQRALGRKFGVSCALICLIVNGARWKHVE